MWKTVRNIEQNNDEKAKIIKFLIQNDNELAVPISQYPWGIEWTVKLFSEKGKILIAEKENEIIWLLGITFWEPSKNYENPEIWYLYLLLFEKQNRNKRDVVVGFFKKLIEEMKENGIHTIRFKADVHVKYTNQIYSKFAKCIWSQKNTQWIECNLYEANIEELYKSFFLENNYRPLQKVE